MLVPLCVCVVCLRLFIAKLIAYLCSLAFNVPAQSELALQDFTMLVLVLKKHRNNTVKSLTTISTRPPLTLHINFSNNPRHKACLLCFCFAYQSAVGNALQKRTLFVSNFNASCLLNVLMHWCECAVHTHICMYVVCACVCAMGLGA